MILATCRIKEKQTSNTLSNGTFQGQTLAPTVARRPMVATTSSICAKASSGDSTGKKVMSSERNSQTVPHQYLLGPIGQIRCYELPRERRRRP